MSQNVPGMTKQHLEEANLVTDLTSRISLYSTVETCRWTCYENWQILYEQYFIQTLHKEGQLTPEESAGGKKNPFFSLPLTPPTHHLKKSVKQLPSYSTRSARLPLSEPLPTTTTGTYFSNTFNFI